MELDQDTKDKLLAVIDGKQMQRMLASEWHDCTMGEALEWLGKDFMRGHIKATGLCWLIHCTSTDITHWRYTHEPRSPK